jgi:hypothetical protein
LREWLAAFLGPRSAPATAVNPGAFAAATTTAETVPSIDSTPWQELGPYAYFPDDRNYVDPVFSNSGSGSGFNTGRITGVAVAPNGDVYAAAAGGGVWRSTDSAHQAWTPVFNGEQTTAEGAVTVVGAGPDYTVYAGTGEPTINLDSYAGVGILASTDHGTTWHRVGGDELVGAAIFKIVPAPGGVLYAATSHGLYRLAAGAAAWQKVIGDPDTNPGTPNAQVLNLVSDVAVRPGTNGKEVVAMRGWRRQLSLDARRRRSLQSDRESVRAHEQRVGAEAGGDRAVLQARRAGLVQPVPRRRPGQFRSPVRRARGGLRDHRRGEVLGDCCAVLEPDAEVLQPGGSRLRRLPEHDALRPARGGGRGRNRLDRQRRRSLLTAHERPHLGR